MAKIDHGYVVVHFKKILDKIFKTGSKLDFPFFQVMLMNIRQRKIKIELVWKILTKKKFEPQRIYCVISKYS